MVSRCRKLLCEQEEKKCGVKCLGVLFDRFSSMEAKHMAKSELSYFVEPAVPKLTGCSAPDDIEKSIGSAYGTLHR